MTKEEFSARHPRLYHMASAGALGQIKKYGLLSTDATLDLLNVPEEQRKKTDDRKTSRVRHLQRPESRCLRTSRPEASAR